MAQKGLKLAFGIGVYPPLDEKNLLSSILRLPRMFAVLILYYFWCFNWHWYFFGSAQKVTGARWLCFFIFASSVGLASPTALVTSLYCQLSTLSVKHSLFSSTSSEKWRREETASSMLSCQLLLWWVPQSSLPITWLHLEFMANSHLYVLLLYYLWQSKQGNM